MSDVNDSNLDANVLEIDVSFLVTNVEHILAPADEEPSEPPAQCGQSDLSSSQPSLNRGLTLASELLDGALSQGTLRQYASAYVHWTSFCCQNGLPELPASVEAVTSCVAIRASETCSASAAETLASAIAYEHKKNFLPSPTLHDTFRLLMRAIRRKFATERTAAAPLTRSILNQMIDYLFQPGHGRDGQLATLSSWRTVWRVCLEFHTLGRFSDLIRLKVADLVFYQNPQPHLRITFRGGKNDLFSEGSERIVSSNSENSTYCPVRLTRLYLARLGEHYQGFVVPRCLSGHGQGRQIPDPVRPLSYTTCLEDFRDLLAILGHDPSRYSEHSGTLYFSVINCNILNCLHISAKRTFISHT
jgi:hypothetical protein